MRRKHLILIAALIMIMMGIMSFLAIKNLSPIGPLQVHLLSSAKTALPDDFLTHVFSVRNRGESADSYELKPIVPEGWKLLDVLNPIHLKPRAEEKIFITVQIPPATSPGRYVLGLTASSQSNPTITASAIAFVKIEPTERVKLRALGERLPIVAGQESHYAFRILNTGNVSAVVQLSLPVLPSGWELRLSEGAVQLAPGESRELAIMIKVPEDTPTGETQIVLKVTTQKSSEEASLFFTVLP